MTKFIEVTTFFDESEKHHKCFINPQCIVMFQPKTVIDNKNVKTSLLVKTAGDICEPLFISESYIEIKQQLLEV